MRRAIADAILELVQGDIARQQVDAIVNAANAALAPGSGVNGAILRAGGPSILEDLAKRYPHGCPTGTAVASIAGDLPARFIFHAVGPIWRGGRQSEPEQLASACRACLELAIEHECRSVAIPAISTGIYGYPVDLAAAELLQTAIQFLTRHSAPQLVRFVLFDAGSLGAFACALDRLSPLER